MASWNLVGFLTSGCWRTHLCWRSDTQQSQGNKSYVNGNIELFNRCVASVFSELYGKFPLPIDLHYNDLAIELWDDEIEEEGAYFDKYEIYAQSVSWLEKAGYIWLNKWDHHEAYGAVLSPKGLEALKVPESIKKPSKTLGAQIGQALEQGAMSSASGLVSQALTASITMAVN